MQRHECVIRVAEKMSDEELERLSRDELWELVTQLNTAMSQNKRISSYVLTANRTNEDLYCRAMDVILDRHEEVKREMRREKENGTV